MSKKRTTLGIGCAIGALYALTAPTFAQVASPEALAAGQAADAAAVDVVVVTGAARPQRRFDVSYAVNVLSQADVQKLAPPPGTWLTCWARCRAFGSKRPAAKCRT